MEHTDSRHPGVRWALGALEFTIIDAMLIFGIVPAWAAALTIPLADRTVTINLGDLPAWVVAAVAAGGFWKAWRAEKRVIAVDTKLAEVGVKIDGLLVARDAAKVKEGEAKSNVAAGLAADQLQKGVEQGIRQERASVAAGNPVPAVAVSNAGVVASDTPVPVTDKSSDRVAVATEQLAKAAETQADIAKNSNPSMPSNSPHEST